MSNARREEFDRRYKVPQENDSKIIPFNSSSRLQPHERMGKRELYEAIGQIEDQLKREERSKNKKRKIKRPQKSPKRRVFTGKRIAAIALAILMSLAVAKGVNTAYTNYQQQNEPVRLEQVIGTGVSLEELGINSEQVSKLAELQNKLGDGNITNEELIRLVPEIYHFQLDITKSKLGKVLGVSPEDIKVFTENAEEGRTREHIEVENKYRTGNSGIP